MQTSIHSISQTKFDNKEQKAIIFETLLSTENKYLDNPMAKTIKSIQSLAQGLIQPLANPMAEIIKSNFHSEKIFFNFKVTNHHRDDLHFHQDHNHDHLYMHLLDFLHHPHTIDFPNHVSHSLAHSLHWELKFIL